MYPVTAAANMATIAIARTKTRRCIVCHLRSSFLIVEANCWIPVQDFSLEIGWICGFIVRVKGLQVSFRYTSRLIGSSLFWLRSYPVTMTVPCIHGWYEQT